jgi:epoxide hydrolase
MTIQFFLLICFHLLSLIHGEIIPFQISYDSVMEQELHSKLNQIRWPQHLDNSANDWDYGIPINVVKEYVDYLLTNYSWATEVAKLNQFPQYVTEIDDYTVHFIHQKSSNPFAKPLIFLHGWPGSFWECHKILPMLTEPQNYGGKPENAFHVICPSIPGYGYSSSPKRKGFDQYNCAQIFSELMNQLNYSQYYIQGGDWGSVVGSLQASLPENSNKILGLHLNMVPVSFPFAKGIIPLISSFASLLLPWFFFTPTERQLLSELPLKGLQETGYFHEQSTRPLTLSYGLSDSPVALLAWIAEKFYVWSDCTTKNFQTVHPPESLLTNFMIYWTTNTAGTVLCSRIGPIGIASCLFSVASSMRFYSEMFNFHQTKQENVFQKLSTLHVKVD